MSVQFCCWQCYHCRRVSMMSWTGGPEPSWFIMKYWNTAPYPAVRVRGYSIQWPLWSFQKMQSYLLLYTSPHLEVLSDFSRSLANTVTENTVWLLNVSEFHCLYSGRIHLKYAMNSALYHGIFSSLSNYWFILSIKYRKNSSSLFKNREIFAS